MPNAWPLGAGEATARRQRGDGGATGRVRGWRSRRRRPRVCTNMAGCDTSARHTSSNTGAGRAGLRPCASELRCLGGTHVSAATRMAACWRHRRLPSRRPTLAAASARSAPRPESAANRRDPQAPAARGGSRPDGSCNR
ncbi:unnamed protein product [Prorocentrum cordatum]|uniref:Uncharacterized protein n=1 Tax=Prorocentrum cordatum TaxID=2364126 RepID=A0ABN9UJZ8_9DINO|nr:unnamed protein product [Polarella glacialis]